MEIGKSTNFTLASDRGNKLHPEWGLERGNTSDVSDLYTKGGKWPAKIYKFLKVYIPVPKRRSLSYWTLVYKSSNYLDGRGRVTSLLSLAEKQSALTSVRTNSSQTYTDKLITQFGVLASGIWVMAGFEGMTRWALIGRFMRLSRD